MTRALTALVAVLALALASCSETYRCIESETLVRFVPEEDALLILEVQRGIESESSGRPGIDRAIEMLRSAAAGRRRYPADGGLISIDLDEESAAEQIVEHHAAAFRELMTLVRVEESGLYLDDQGRLSFFRLTRLEHCARLLALVSEWINREESGAEKEARPFVPEFPFFDEASWRGVRAALGAGHRWLNVVEGAIVLDLPMTDANAARCLAWIVGETRKDPNVAALQLFEQISSFEVADGHARIRFGAEPRPIVRFTTRPSRQTYDDDLKQRLDQLGVKLGKPDAPAGARAKVERAAPSPTIPK